METERDQLIKQSAIQSEQIDSIHTEKDQLLNNLECLKVEKQEIELMRNNLETEVVDIKEVL